MRKFSILVFIMLVMLFCFACVDLSTIDGPSDLSNLNPALLTVSDEVFQVLKLPVAPDDESNGDQDINYNIVMDSRIASSNGSSGYLKRNCYTFPQILACLKASIAGEKYVGYYSGYDEKQQFDENTQTNTSVVISNYIRSDDFFASAVSAGFPNTDMLPAKVIEQISKDANRNSVYVFITDMAMPEASESFKISEALGNIISNTDLTVGLIGIKADYAGIVYDIPISHLGVNLPENESYQKPIYLLYIGEKKAVFEAMDNFLLASESNSSLNSNGQTNALYYYKYNCKTNEDVKEINELQPTVSVSCSGLLKSYMKDCKPEYIFQIPEGMDPKKLTDVEKLIDGILISKIYIGAKMDERILSDKNNIEYSFDIPFQIVSDTGSASSNLLKPGKSIALSDLEASLVMDIQRVLLEKQGEALQMCDPESVNSKELNLYLDTAIIDLDNASVNVFGDFNISELKQDEPVIYKVKMAVKCTATSDILAKAYDASWLNEWQMDLTQLQKEWGRDTAVEQALNTPYIADIFGKTLLEANIASAQKYISTSTAQYFQGVNVGFVMREQAAVYDSNEAGNDYSEDFGWAFSRWDVKPSPTPGLKP